MGSDKPATGRKSTHCRSSVWVNQGAPGIGPGAPLLFEQHRAACAVSTGSMPIQLSQLGDGWSYPQTVHRSDETVDVRPGSAGGREVPHGYPQPVYN